MFLSIIKLDQELRFEEDFFSSGVKGWGLCLQALKAEKRNNGQWYYLLHYQVRALHLLVWYVLPGATSYGCLYPEGRLGNVNGSANSLVKL